MSRGLAIATIALTLVCAHGAARAQTVVRVPMGYDPAATQRMLSLSLYIPFDPTRLKVVKDIYPELRSVSDETVSVSITSAVVETCAEVPGARLARGDFSEGTIARPTWVPSAYDGLAEDRYNDGRQLELCLDRADGAIQVSIAHADRDLPAVVNALEGVIAATATMPDGATLADVGAEVHTLPGGYAVAVRSGEWMEETDLQGAVTLRFLYYGLFVKVRHVTAEYCLIGKEHPPAWLPTGFLSMGSAPLEVSTDTADVICRAIPEGKLELTVTNAARELPTLLALLEQIALATPPPAETPPTTIVRPAKAPRKPLGLELTLAARSLNADGTFGDDGYGGAIGAAKGVHISTKQGFPATLFVTLQGELGYSGAGVDYDAQLRTGLHMGRQVGVTFLVLGGVDAFDPMTAEGYWGVGAALDAYVSRMIFRVEASTVGRLGPDDVVDKEVRLEGAVTKDRYTVGVRRSDLRLGSEHPLVALALFAGVRL